MAEISNYTSGTIISGTNENDSIYNYNYATNVSINAGEGANYIYNDGDCHYVTMMSGSGADTVHNSGDDGVVIMVGEGNDSVRSYGNNVIILLGNGDDQTDGFGANVTISGDLGDDSITLHSDYSESNSFKYVEGDGNDTIWNYSNDDTIQIDYSGEVTTVTGGENNKDLIINVGNGSMRLVDAADVTPVVVDPSGNIITLGNGGTDTGSGGEDTVTPVDTITPVTTPADISTVYVDLSTIGSNSGALVIDGTSSYATLKSAAAENETVVGNVAGQIYTAENILPQSINNSNANWTINATAQNDSITNYASNVFINAGEGDNYIRNNDNCTYVTVTAGSGNDKIQNYGRFAVINAGDGNDSILTDINANVSSNDSEYRNVTVYGGAGNDTLDVNDHESLLDGGAGNDVIRVKDSNRWKTNTLQGGTGNDTLYGGGSNVFVYNEGDGDDLVKNYRTGDALKISTTYDTVISGNDVIINVAGNGHITLEAASDQKVVINPPTVETATMHMSRWSYSFVSSTVSNSSNLASSEDLINGDEVSYYYGRGSQITYNADKNDTVNLFGVSLDQITSAEISAGAVKIGFNDGGNLTMLGQSNSQFVLNGSTWTADQSTQSWTQTN